MRGALLCVLLSACATREAGIEVEVSLAVGAVPTTGPRLDLARLSLTSARGVPCTEVMAALSPLSTAWAHGAHTLETSPLLADVAVDVDLLTPATTPLATLRPPPGLWCALELGFARSTTDTAWGGTTLLVDAADASASTRYLSTSERHLQLLFMPLTLSEAQRHHHLTVGLDPAALSTLQPSTNDARRELLDTLLASLSLSAVETLK